MVEEETTSLDIANYFIEKSSNSEGITHLKLQKLVYCAQGWWLAYAKEGLVEGKLFNELPQAWNYGPVYEFLYGVLKVSKQHYQPIQLEPLQEPKASLPERTQKFLDWVYARYQSVSGIGMTDLTHKEGTPWHAVTKGGKEVKFAQAISESLIAEEFSSLLVELRGK